MTTPEITNYDRWKFRRCMETIKKDQCPDSCDRCTFDIVLWKHVAIASEDCYIFKVQDVCEVK